MFSDSLINVNVLPSEFITQCLPVYRREHPLLSFKLSLKQTLDFYLAKS